MKKLGMGLLRDDGIRKHKFLHLTAIGNQLQEPLLETGNAKKFTK